MNQEQMPTEHVEQLPAAVAGSEEGAVRRFAYDPNTLKDISANDIDAIDDLVGAAYEQQLEPHDIQEMVDAELTKRGLDPAQAQDGVMVVRFIGVDGKTQVRAMRIDYGDFGTALRNAELLEAAAPEYHVEEPVSEAEKVTSEEEDAHEQETLMAELMDRLYANVTRLDLSSEIDAQLRKRIWGQVESLIPTIQGIMRQINDGMSPDPTALRQLEDTIIGDVVRELSTLTGKTDTDRRSVRQLEDTFGEVRHESLQTLDGTHADEFDAVLRRANDIHVELGSNRSKEDAATAAAKDTCAQLGRVIGEMAYSRHGHEEYAVRLREITTRLNQQVDMHRTSESQLARLVGDLRGALDSNATR